MESPSAFSAVFAAALANGGSFDDVRPGPSGYGLRVRGFAAAERTARAAELLELVGLPGRQDHRRAGGSNSAPHPPSCTNARRPRSLRSSSAP